jgi:hypothetical protein
VLFDNGKGNPTFPLFLSNCSIGDPMKLISNLDHYVTINTRGVAPLVIKVEGTEVNSAMFALHKKALTNCINSKVIRDSNNAAPKSLPSHLIPPRKNLGLSDLPTRKFAAPARAAVVEKAPAKVEPPKATLAKAPASKPGPKPKPKQDEIGKPLSGAPDAKVSGGTAELANAK